MSQPKKKTASNKKSSKKISEDKKIHEDKKPIKTKSIEVKSAPELPEQQTKEPTKTTIKIIDHNEIELAESQKEQDTKDADDKQSENKKTPDEDIETASDTEIQDEQEIILSKSEDNYKDEVVPENNTRTSEEIVLDKDNEDIEVKSLDELEGQNISKAVDDIVAHESDDALKAEVGEGPPQSKIKKADNKPKSIKRKKHPLKFLVFLIFIALLAIVVYPKSRYFLLERFGIKADVQVSVVDNSTNTPVNNAQVTIGTVTAKTDKHGVAKLSKVTIGPTQLVIDKPAYENYSQNVSIGFGNNKLTEVRTVPIGQQYSFVLRDYLSDKPIEGVEASSGEFSAMSDSNGRVKIPIDIKGKDDFDIKFIKEDYRIDEYRLPTTTNTETNYQLVASRKHVYLSKDDDRYNIYSVDLDGKNQKLILKGTGNEGDGLRMYNNPLSNALALTSTRNSQKNKSGEIMVNLTVLDYGVGKVYDSITSDNIQVIGWVGNKLIYVYEPQDSKPDALDRHKLVSYDFKTDTQKELAVANYFNDVKIVGQNIYFARSSQNIANKVGLVRSSADGTSQETVVGSEVNKIYRQGYNNLVVTSYDKWLNIDLSSGNVTMLTTKPSDLSNKIFIDSPNKQTALFTKNQNNIDQLLNYLPTSNEEQLLSSIEGSSYPIYWLNETDVIFRVKEQQGYFDYIVSTEGGDSKRLAEEVYPEQSVDEWYYY